MKKVAKKKNLKNKKNIQNTKKRKTKKTNIPPKTKNNRVIDKNTTKKIKTIAVDEIKETKKVENNSLTKSMAIPKVKEDRFSLTKSLSLPKLKISNDKILSLTKSISIPKLKNKDLTKSITIPKIDDKNIEYIELDLYDDEYFKEAEKLYKNKEYDSAYKLYCDLLDKYKKDKRLYKRLICSLTKDYTYKINSKEFKKVFDDYVNTYRILANKRELKSFEYNLDNYKNVKGIKIRSRFLLIAFLGYFGIHKFIEKKIVLGILYLFTLGFLGIGVLIDLINDYAEYEDTLQLDILRYIISFGILVVGILNKNLEYYYLIIISSIIFLPIVYSFILKYIPGLIKIIAMIILILYGFKVDPVIEYVPNSFIGSWKTTNENTNYEELNIKLEKSTLIFDDRDKEVGTNKYDSQNKILTIKISDTKSYRFIVNIDENKLCSYNDSRECIIEFTKGK